MYLMIFHKKQTNASQIHKTVMSQFEDKINIIKDRFSDKYLMFRVEEMENPREIITELFQVDKSINLFTAGPLAIYKPLTLKGQDVTIRKQ